MRQLRIVLWLAVIFAGTAFGQGAKTVPAASAPQAQASTQTTVAAMVDRDISAVEKQVVEATEAMPEEKFNFTPETLNIPGDDYKGVRSFAVQVKHIASSNYFIWSPITGDLGPVELKSRAEILKFLKDSFALGHKAAATLTAQNMLEPAANGKSQRLHLAEFGVAHAYNHYGQMVEYLRMNGIIPPASRGKSD